MDESARGMLLGLAIGDALGMPVEFMSLPQIRKTYGPSGLQGFLSGRGLFTDDTQMSLAVAQALVEAGRLPLAELMEVVVLKFVEWAASPENDRSPGLTTMNAVHALESGKSWKESGSLKSKGCGSVMRTAPIGYFFGRDPDRMREAAHAVGMATHAHPTADAACLAASLAVRLALDGLDPREWSPQLKAFARGQSPELDATLDRVDAACRIPDPDFAVSHVSSENHGWTADEVLGTALLCVIRHPDDFRASLLLAVNNSGDSDSIGCVTGALQGARLGASAIPAEWLDGIERRQEIERLADRLAEARAAAGF